MKTLAKRALPAGMCLFLHTFILAGPPRIIQGLTMLDAIGVAIDNSLQSKMYRNSYEAGYWEYRSYRASFRPFLKLSADLGGLNRSMVILQDFNTGNLAYRTNWSLTDDACLSLEQAVPLTGGTLSLSAQLSRLDQYLPSRSVTYYAQPLYLGYSQSLGGYNQYRWNRKILPEQYELYRREYVEQMENLKSSVIASYWNYVSLIDSYERCLKDFDESQRLYALAKRRHSLGLTEKRSLQQLELKLVEDSIEVSNRRLAMQIAHDNLCSHMGILEDTELELTPDFHVPNVVVPADDVIQRVLENSSYSVTRHIQSMQSQQNVERTRASTGLQASVSLRVGLSGTGNLLSSALGMLHDQEIASVSISVPIVDWGEGRARVRQARAQADMVDSSLEQNMSDYRRELVSQVMAFNNMGMVCRLSERAFQLAQENYSDAIQDYSMGRLTVTELNYIRSSRDEARLSYIGNVASFWQQYYNLRSITHWDYIENMPVSEDFNTMENELKNK